MANAKKADNSKKVFDVSKPGKSAPAASAKPIIVTNRPILQDPMVVNDQPSDAPAASTPPEPAKTSTSTKVTVKPITISSPDDGESLEDNKVDVATNAPADAGVQDSLPEEPKEEAPKEAEKPAKPEPEAEAVAQAAAPAPATPPTPAPGPSSPAQEGPAKDNEEDEEPKVQSPDLAEAAKREAEKQAAEHAAAIQKLVESREYFLPINSVEKRKTKHFIIGGVVVALLLAAAWIDVALDAGLIHLNGVHALTHFFKG